MQEKSISADTRLLLAIVCTLIIVGCIFIYSASSVYALEKMKSAHYYLIRQLVGVVLGFSALLCIQYIPLRIIKKSIPYFFLISLLLTACTFLPGFSCRVHGARRWLNIAGFVFQPSELLKIGLIAYLAYLLSKRSWNHISIIRDYLPLLIIIALPCILLLLQPDFGTAVTLAITSLILLFVAQFNVRILACTLLAFVPLAFALIVLKPYRFKRLLIFLNPWNDPQGSGFQIIQSLIAIGTGSWFGVGIGNSHQKFFYLPMQHTDFIFSVIAEEIGFIGSSAIILLFLLFIHRGYKIALQAQDDFPRYMTAGFISLLGLQALINFAVTTGIVPTKGIGLPFVSYGNTSLVGNLIMIGLIIRAQKE